MSSSFILAGISPASNVFLALSSLYSKSKRSILQSSPPLFRVAPRRILITAGFNVSLKKSTSNRHCTGQKIRIADIVDKYDVLVPSAHSIAVSRLRVVPLACLGDLTGCFGYDQIHSEKRSWLDVDAF